MRGNFSFKFFVIVVIGALILPQIFRDGIFMDGNLYASVAVNFARGEGTFWSPHFAKESMSFFHEQPPLMFGMLGMFYKLFGEHMVVERIYSLVMFALSLVVFLRIWRSLFKDDARMLQWRWMATLIWIMIPNAPWVVIHNLEENTMGFFVLLSVYFQLMSLQASGVKNFGFIFLSSASLGAAFLTKGFPGLFPLCFLPACFLFYPVPERRIIIFSFALFILVTAVFSILLFTYPPSEKLLETWINERVLNSIKNVSNSSSRFELIGFLFMQLIPVFLLGALLFGLSLIKKISLSRLSSSPKRKALVFLLLAVAGSFPLIVTREQRGFYLATSYPYYAIALCIYFSPAFDVLKAENWPGRLLKFFRTVPFAAAAGVIAVTIYLLPTAKRDAEKFHDFNVLKKDVAYGSYIAVSEKLWNDWELQTGLVRTNYISLTKDKSKTGLLIYDPVNPDDTDTSGYTYLNLPLKRYRLYSKN